MKKSLCLLLCVMLLAGCAPVVPNGTTQAPAVQPTTATSIPTESTVDAQLPPAEPLQGYAVPPVDPDYFELLCENYQSKVYLLADEVNRISLYLLSTQEMVGEGQLTICSDIGTPLPVEFVSMRSYASVPPYWVFLSYQKKDWTWADITKNAQAYADEMEAFEGAYKKLVQAWQGFEAFYVYRLALSPEVLGVDVEKLLQQAQSGQMPEPITVKKLTLNADGITREYDVDITFYTENCPGVENQSPVISMDYGSLEEIFSIAHNGKIRLQKTASSPAREALQIRKVTIQTDTETLALKNCWVETAIGETLLDGDTLVDIPKDMLWNLKLELECPELAWELQGNHSFYIILHYTVDGVEYQEAVRCAVAPYPNFHEYYAMMVQGMDTMAYFRDHYYLVDNPLDYFSGEEPGTNLVD